MGNFIGDKDLFAIEYEFTDHSEFHNAKTRIWLDNSYFGNYEDSSPIYGVFQYLDFISDNFEKFLSEEFKGKTKEEIYYTMIPYDTDEEYYELPELVIDGLIKYDKNIGSYNEAYDEFVTRIYIEDDNIHFIWKLITDEERYEEFYKGCSRDIVHKWVRFEYFKKVMNDFRQVLLKEKILQN